MDPTKYNEAAARPENAPSYSATVGELTVTMTRKPDAWRVEITDARDTRKVVARCPHPGDAIRQAEQRALDAGMTREYVTQAASQALDACMEAGETAVDWPARRCACDAWRHALEAATDHERYGPAITSIAGEWTLGDTAPLAFCPWCGRPAPRL